MKKMISIIIPVYNTEKYIGNCLNSILNQSYNNFEVIVIDDGSSDRSFDICKKISEGDSRVRLYRQSNFGVSVARNKGIEKSKGDYLMFIDSDDYLEPNSLIEVSKFFDDNCLLVFGYKKVYKNKEIKYVNSSNIYKYGDDVLESIFFDDSVSGYLWNKVFSAKIIKDNNLCFDYKIHYSEDLIFCLNYLKYCSKIRVVDFILYCYRMRKSGVSYKYINKKNSSILDSYKLLLNSYSLNNRIRSKLELLYLMEYWKFKKIYNAEKVLNDILLRENEILNQNNFSVSKKIKYYLIYRNRIVYIFFKKLKNLVEKTFD